MSLVGLIKSLINKKKDQREKLNHQYNKKLKNFKKESTWFKEIQCYIFHYKKNASNSINKKLIPYYKENKSNIRR